MFSGLVTDKGWEHRSFERGKNCAWDTKWYQTKLNKERVHLVIGLSDSVILVTRGDHATRKT